MDYEKPEALSGTTIQQNVQQDFRPDAEVRYVFDESAPVPEDRRERRGENLW